MSRQTFSHTLKIKENANESDRINKNHIYKTIQLASP